MSLTIGFSHPGAVTIGGKTAATINAMNQAEADASEEALGVEKEQSNQVRTGGPAQEASQASSADSGDSLSITVKMLLKRMQELQKQLLNSNNNWRRRRRQVIRRPRPSHRRSCPFRARSRKPAAR
jgi:hypothetical protein